MNVNEAKIVRSKLEALFDQHGLEGYDVVLGNGTFDNTEVTFKLTIRDEGEDSEELKWAKLKAQLHGFAMKADGKEIVGYKRRAPKRPWIVKHPDGKTYVYPTAMMDIFKKETV